MSCFMVINGSCSTNMCARQLSFNFSSMIWGGGMAPWPPIWIRPCRHYPLLLCNVPSLRQRLQVRDIDSHLSMQVHVLARFAVLRQLRSIRRLVPSSSVYQSLVVALVLCTVAMRHRFAFRSPCLTVSSPSSTRQLGRSLASVVQSILQMLSPALTAGSEHIKFKLAVMSSSSELLTALHVSTDPASCSTLLICRRDVEADCARLRPVCLTSVRHDLSLSAIAHLLLPDHDSGTVYPSTSSLPHHSHHCVRN